jgi:uncharacterized repeat protein (TIGR01451 family)
VSTCDPGISTSFSPASVTVTSGDDAAFVETISVAPSTLGGSYSCSTSFQINGVDAGPDFVQTVGVVVPSPDLSVTKSGPALVTEGSDAVYTIVVTNNGPTNATGVSVTDTVTGGTPVSAPGCTIVAGTVTCTVGNLAVGDSQTFTITVTAGSGSSVDDTATTGGDQTDPNPGTNSASVSTTINHNPVCTALTAGPSLWPPNHKLRTVTVTGGTDPDGNPVTTTITGVTQDEALNGLGDGDTSPDAAWVTGHADQVQLRAERSGLGDGRVYRIATTVSDGLGGQCTGTALVGVPHDQGNGSTPIDSGLVVNSFGP